MLFNLAVICGGPSQERGISLNSARSVFDHLSSASLRVHPIYVDPALRFYRLSETQLYSNTPADFDFKLNETAELLELPALKVLLQQMDLVFPAIHGKFGETGELQALLESLEVPFVGSGSQACKNLFFKHCASELLLRNGFHTIPAALLDKGNSNNLTIVERFFRSYEPQRAIIKPSAGGSSIGVHSVYSPQEALEQAQLIFKEEIDNQVLLEPFIEGKEFTVVVFQNQEGEPYALIPSEIEVSYEDHGIFDYRRKYLPSSNTRYHTPARFSDETLTLIQREAEAIFRLFEMKDFGRIDGWYLPNGKILFTDINPISGMEQNSFVFRQSSLIGLNHRETLMAILQSACSRYSLQMPTCTALSIDSKKSVYVLFGGTTAERQVSLMSGSNVWLKLVHSAHYLPQPYFLDANHQVWTLPYSHALNHSCEEVFDSCLSGPARVEKINAMKDAILKRAKITPMHPEEVALPEALSLNAFLQKAKKKDAFVFIALHGGSGENGELQSLLAEHQVAHNGSPASPSHLCMDKLESAQAIQKAQIPHLCALDKVQFTLTDFLENNSLSWNKIIEILGCTELIIKPQYDGCSCGIIRLKSQKDLETYIDLLKKQANYIPAHTFQGQNHPIEMPTDLTTHYIIEPYIEVNSIKIKEHTLVQKNIHGWIELTVGVLEKEDCYHALSPSITIAEGASLSLEEKFQGGTGINLTPPPTQLIHQEDNAHIRKQVEIAAQILGIRNYARIDIFFNSHSKDVIFIEANTLPGLSPSTVLYHQALAESPPLPPHLFLEQLIQSAWEAHLKKTNDRPC